MHRNHLLSADPLDNAPDRRKRHVMQVRFGILQQRQRTRSPSDSLNSQAK
jgi:hypothetical protein